MPSSKAYYTANENAVDDAEYRLYMIIGMNQESPSSHIKAILLLRTRLNYNMTLPKRSHGNAFSMK